MRATARTEYHRLLPALLTAEPYEEARTPRSTRDWIVDVIFFLIGGGLIPLIWLNEGTNGNRPTNHYLIAIDFVLGGLSVLALWVRRRWPVALNLVLLPVGLIAQTSSGAAILILFTVAVHRRFPVVAAIAVLSALFLIPTYVLYPDDNLAFWANLLISVVFLTAIVAWGMFVRASRQLLLSLRERAVRAEATQQLKVEQAQQRERERIAREMHDVLAHRISLLSLHAGALEFRPDAPAAEIARAAGVIRQSAREALQDLREVIGVLRQEPGESTPERPQPTLSDLPELVAESRAAGMRIELDRDGVELADVPTAAGRTAYRIVQEGLTNVRKHAPNTVARVRLAGGPGDGLRVEVRNPTPVGARLGTPTLPGSGTGIIGLTERATLAGGRIEHGLTDAGEFRLAVWIPWPT